MAKYGSSWHVARTEIVSSYRAFSKEKIVAELGAYIGLAHVNITLCGKYRSQNVVILSIVLGRRD